MDPSQAVAGQIQVGHRVTIYRLVAMRPQETEVTTAADLLAQDAAAVEVLAENVLVVDTLPWAGREGGEWPTSANILTVAVPHQTAAELIKLVGEQKAEYDLWVSLAPAVTFSLVNAGEPSITPIATPHIRRHAGENQ